MAHEVLIVDDEADICDLVSGILVDEGFRTRSAADSDSALAAIHESLPSLLLLDIWLDGSELDGLKLMSLAQQIDADLPVVMISGHGNIETAVASIKAGAYDYIEKPFKADRLITMVRRAIEAARLRLATVEAQHQSLAARYAAERTKYGFDPGDAKKLALTASRSERLLAVRKLEEQLTRDRIQMIEAKQKQSAGDAKAAKAITAAEKNLANHKKQLMEARAGLEGDSAKYKSIGSTHPKTSTGRRLALARWITSRENPLTARVAVNHIWLRHFNEPLVERMFDFGLRSPKPAHSDLLDWLAVQFIEDGWSMKKLHRLMVTSGAYRRASSAGQAPNPSSKLDPDNHFFWRMNARRAEAEAVRDSILHLGGSLDLATGGPPIDNKQGQKVLRRSIFFRHDKERQMTFLSLFDGAKVNECYRRHPTVAPQQALAMYNSPIAAAQSQKIASAFAPNGNREFIDALFEHILCRPPTPGEREECETFLADIPDRGRARQQLTLVLLNHNDFVTIR